MALTDDAAVVAALRGLPHERHAVEAALRQLETEIRAAFGGIKAGEILDTMF